MQEHIDKVIKKANGLLGALCRASPYLSRELLNLAYTSLVRTHLEYCSAILQPLAPTHLKKLDIIQKKAARIICGASRMAHAAPLLESLHLQPLEVRRCLHITDLVETIISDTCHPAFHNFFTTDNSGDVILGRAPRLRMGARRFGVMGARIYNDMRHFQEYLPPSRHLDREVCGEISWASWP